MTRRELSLQQVLEWNPNWSYTDRESILHHINRIGAHTFYVPSCGGYIGCRDVPGVHGPGRNLMTIHPGYLKFSIDQLPEDPPEPWAGLTLSTFLGHESSNPAPEAEQRVCSQHHLALPASGICDECE